MEILSTSVDEDDWASLLPINAKRIRRDTGEQIAEFRFTEDIARTLVQDNLGIIVDCCGKIGRVVKKLKQLDGGELNGEWIVVFDSKLSLRYVYDLWYSADEFASPQEKIPIFWRTSKLLFATPESLSQAYADLSCCMPRILGVLVFDWLCMIHRARGNNAMYNDRPQRIVDFRAKLQEYSRSAPMFLFIDRAINSIDVEAIRIAYALEGLWYLDGQSFSCKETRV